MGILRLITLQKADTEAGLRKRRFLSQVSAKTKGDFLTEICVCTRECGLSFLIRHVSQYIYRENIQPENTAEGVFFGEKSFFSAFGLAFFAFPLYNTSKDTRVFAPRPSGCACRPAHNV